MTEYADPWTRNLGKMVVVHDRTGRDYKGKLVYRDKILVVLENGGGTATTIRRDQVTSLAEG